MSELTRNLYRVEEVKAALIYALHTADLEKATYWAEELAVSGVSRILQESLIYFWLWHICPHDYQLPVSITCLNLGKTISPEVIYLLSRCIAAHGVAGNSSEVLSLLVSGTQPLSPSEKTKPADEDEIKKANELAAQTGIDPTTCHKIREAARSGSLIRAWHFSSKVPTTQFQLLASSLARGTPNERSLVRSIIKILSDLGGLWLSPCMAAITSLLCLRSDKRAEYAIAVTCTPPTATLEQLEEWRCVCGTRAGRVFPIPLESLYWWTERGTTSSNKCTLSQIRNIVPAITSGCPFWRNTVNTFGIKLDANQNIDYDDDELYEQFFEQYFPQDIPDEWSLTDQKKSHGPGILQERQIPTVVRFADIWFPDFRKSKYYNKFVEMIAQNKEWNYFKL